MTAFLRTLCILAAIALAATAGVSFWKAETACPVSSCFFQDADGAWLASVFSSALAVQLWQLHRLTAKGRR